MSDRRGRLRPRQRAGPVGPAPAVRRPAGPRAAVDAFLTDFDFPAFNHQPGRGAVRGPTRGSSWPRVAPEHVPALDLYVEHFADSLVGPGARVRTQLVGTCAAAGVRLLGLTNWSAETFHLAEPAAPAIGLLEDVARLRARSELAKPDRADLPAADRPLRPGPGADACSPTTRRANVAAAAAGAGFDAVAVHVRATTCARELVARGVPPAAHLGSRPCDCSSPELPRPRCRRSRRSSAPVTRSSRCSPAPTPGPAAAARSAPSAVKARALEAGLEVLTPRAPARRGRSRPGSPSSPSTPRRRRVRRARSRPRCSTSRRTAGSTCTSRSCPPGAAPRRCSTRSSRATRSPGASTFRLEAGLDTGPVFGFLTETIRPRDTSGDLLGRLAVAGAGLLVQTLDALEDGILSPVDAARPTA